MAMIEAVIDVSKFVAVIVIFFVIAVTINDLSTNGLQPVTAVTTKIFLYSIGLAIGLWIIFAIIAYRQKRIS